MRMNLTCEYELDILPNTKVSPAKDHGENYMKVILPLVRHLLRNYLFHYDFSQLSSGIYHVTS